MINQTDDPRIVGLQISSGEGLDLKAADAILILIEEINGAKKKKLKQRKRGEKKENPFRFRGSVRGE